MIHDDHSDDDDGISKNPPTTNLDCTNRSFLALYPTIQLLCIKMARDGFVGNPLVGPWTVHASLSGSDME